MVNDVPNRKPFTEKLRVPKPLTSDDVLFRPVESRVEPGDADVSARVSKNVGLNIPILLATMDTVTESEVAIGMTREGDLGVLHRNMNAEQMVREAERVKRTDKLIIRREDVVTANPGQTIGEVDGMMKHAGASGAPVVDDDDVVLGTISGTDIHPYLEVNESDEVGETMTDEVITVECDVTARDAFELMYDHEIGRVPIVGDDSRLVDLVTMQGILQHREHENTACDDGGHLICGIAVGPFDDERTQMADDAGTDVIFIDYAHVHNLNVIDTARDIKESVKANVIVGNIGTREAAAKLVNFTDDIRVGIGPDSICTTRVISDSGMPQISTVAEVADVTADHDIPVTADGSIRYSGDAVKTATAGTDVVMFGSYFAGTDETPGRVVTMNGKKCKQYRGVGSVGAMQSDGAGHYLKEGNEDEEYVPEGVEVATPYRGSLASELHQLVGGMQSGMGYVGAETIPEVKERAHFVHVSAAGQTGDHPHDVAVTDEAPNYSPSE